MFRRDAAHRAVLEFDDEQLRILEDVARDAKLGDTLAERAATILLDLSSDNTDASRWLDQAVAALGSQGSDNAAVASRVLKGRLGLALERLLQQLWYGPASGRAWAALTLGFGDGVGSERKWDLLEAALRREDDPAVRCACLRSLAHLGGRDLDRILMSTLSDVDGSVRLEALFAARSRTVGPRVLDLIKVMACNDPSDDVRDLAASEAARHR
jgi:hypothetical protein